MEHPQVNGTTVDFDVGVPLDTGRERGYQVIDDVLATTAVNQT